MVLSKKTKRNGVCKVIKCSMCIRISVCFPGALSCFLRLDDEHESKHFWLRNGSDLLTMAEWLSSGLLPARKVKLCLMSKYS